MTLLTDQVDTTKAASPNAAPRPRRTPHPARAIWGWGLAGALLTYAAFPPLGWSLCGWIGPACWIHLARRIDGSVPRTWLRVYLVGLLFWLITLQWVRLPHPATYLGWLALSAYLAWYVVGFVYGVRWWHRQHRWPLWIAAPVLWVGLEWLRGVLLSGFSLALLCHTQVQHVPLLQLAAWGGGYLLSGLMVFTAAALEHLWAHRRVGWRFRKPSDGAESKPSDLHSVSLPWWRRIGPLVTALILVALAWLGGDRRVKGERPVGSVTQVALIQGSIDTEFDGDPDTGRRTMQEYVTLTRNAQSVKRPPELIIWPESMFAADFPIVYPTPPLRRPPEYQGTDEEYQRDMAMLAEWRDEKTRGLASLTGTTSLVGGQVWETDAQGRRLYNSALLIDSQGAVTGRYDKVHTVMFGEYIPLGEWIPAIYRLTPLPNGLTRGQQPQLFTVGDLKISPSICFENTVPHLLRRQVNELSKQGRAPNCLVTITNDGWFWGSSLLDMHLACGVFRAVELDLPMLIAANTGFSAYITPRGRISDQGPRRAPVVVQAGVTPGRGESWYRVWGDSPYMLAAAVTLWPVLLSVWRRGMRRWERA